MKILVADDHPIFRQGILKILQNEPWIDSFTEASDGETALRKILEMNPDIAIIDIAMPRLSGLDVVRRAREMEECATEFIVLTMYPEEEYFHQALDVGVKGYLLKENAADALIECAKAVADGRYFTSPTLSDSLLKRTRLSGELYRQNSSLESLTPTERRILALIAQNLTSKEIAAMLHVSYRTIQNHRANICSKLGLEGYNKLLQFALEHREEL